MNKNTFTFLSLTLLFSFPLQNFLAYGGVDFADPPQPNDGQAFDSNAPVLNDPTSDDSSTYKTSSSSLPSPAYTSFDHMNQYFKNLEEKKKFSEAIKRATGDHQTFVKHLSDNSTPSVSRSRIMETYASLPGEDSQNSFMDESTGALNTALAQKNQATGKIPKYAQRQLNTKVEQLVRRYSQSFIPKDTRLHEVNRFLRYYPVKLNWQHDHKIYKNARKKLDFMTVPLLKTFNDIIDKTPRVKQKEKLSKTLMDIPSNKVEPFVKQLEKACSKKEVDLMAPPLETRQNKVISRFTGNKQQNYSRQDNNPKITIGPGGIVPQGNII